MNRRTHIAWLVPGVVLAWVLSALVTSGQQSQNQKSGGNGSYKQKYPTKNGKGKNVPKFKGKNSNTNSKKGTSGGGGSITIPQPTIITFSTFRLRLRGFRTPMNRRMPPSRPAMSAISGARFQQPAVSATTQTPVAKGKSSP